MRTALSHRRCLRNPASVILQVTRLSGSLGVSLSSIDRFTPRFEQLPVTDGDLLASGILLPVAAPVLAPDDSGSLSPEPTWLRALRQLHDLKYIAGSPDAVLDTSCVAHLLATFAELCAPYATARAMHLQHMWQAALELLRSSVLPVCSVGKSERLPGEEDTSILAKCVLDGMRTLFAQQRFNEMLKTFEQVLASNSTLENWLAADKVELVALCHAAAFATCEAAKSVPQGRHFKSRSIPADFPKLLEMTKQVLLEADPTQARPLLEILAARKARHQISLADVCGTMCMEKWEGLVSSLLSDENNEVRDALLATKAAGEDELLSAFRRSCKRDQGLTTLLRASLLLGERVFRFARSDVESTLGSSLGEHTVRNLLERMTWDRALEAVVARHDLAAHADTVRVKMTGNYSALYSLQQCLGSGTWDSALRWISNLVTIGSPVSAEDARRALQLTSQVEKDAETITLFDTLRQSTRRNIEQGADAACDVTYDAADVAMFAAALRRRGLWQRAIDVVGALLQTADGGELKPEAVSVSLAEVMHAFSDAKRWSDALALASSMGSLAHLSQHDHFYRSLCTAPGDVWVRALLAYPPSLSSGLTVIAVAQLVAVHDPEQGIKALGLVSANTNLLSSSFALGGWYRYIFPLVGKGTTRASHVLAAMAVHGELIDRTDFVRAASMTKTAQEFSQLFRLARRNGFLDALLEVVGENHDIGRLCKFYLQGGMRGAEFTKPLIPFAAQTIARSGLPFSSVLFQVRDADLVMLKSRRLGGLRLQRGTVGNGSTLLRCSLHDVTPPERGEIPFMDRNFTVLRKAAGVELSSIAAQINRTYQSKHAVFFHVPGSLSGLCLLVASHLPQKNVLAFYVVELALCTSQAVAADERAHLPCDILAERVKCVMSEPVSFLPNGHLAARLTISCSSGVEAAGLTEALKMLEIGGWVLSPTSLSAAEIREMQVVISGRRYSFSLPSVPAEEDGREK